MKHISHDLASCCNRLTRMSNLLDARSQALTEGWKDQVGRGFVQHHITPIAPQLNLLISELAVAIEQFECIAKQLQDQDFR